MSARGSFGRLATILLAGGGLPSPGVAQTAPPSNTTIEQVVVTAQRRTEKAQDIPISVTAFDKRILKDLKLVNTQDLAQFVPNMQIAMPSGTGNQPLISIRGVGLNDTNTNNAGPNGVYVDEVYAASPAAQTFQLFDLDRVEVLKGPQGTLYGRNSTGGAINYITAKPTDDFHMSQDILYGSWNTYAIQSMVNGNIAPGLDGRLAFVHNYSDGYFTNENNGKTTNGANDYAWRLMLKYQPSDDVTLLGNFHGGIVNRRPDEYRSVGALQPGLFGAPCNDTQILGGQCTDAFGYNGSQYGFYKGRYNRDQNLWITSYGGWVRADKRLDDVTLTSITSVETDHKNHPEDTDADPYRLIEINYGVRSTDVTQEFRATGSGPGYNWVAGLYYLSEHLIQDQPISLFLDLDKVVGEAFGLPGPLIGIGAGTAEKARTLNGQFTQSAAAYGQGDYEIFDRTKLTLGGRYTYEHKSFDALSQASFEQTDGSYPPPSTLYNISRTLYNGAASGRAALDYKLTESVLAYVSASTGFKSGGFNGGFLDNDVSQALIQLRPIKPESIDAFEAGLKSDLFDHRVRLNVAAFYYDYHDLQIYNLINPPPGVTPPVPITVLANAPRATIKGVEVEFDAKPIPNLTTSVNLGFLQTSLGTFVSGAGTPSAQSFTGNQFPNAPKFSAVMIGDYRIPFVAGDGLSLNAELSYRSHQFFESSNNPLVAQNGYWLLDARIAYTTADTRWTLAILGKNLTGTQYQNFASDLTSGLGFIEEVVGPPRFVGAEATYAF
jgi:iron complex outermembrane receptor protein